MTRTRLVIVGSLLLAAPAFAADEPVGGIHWWSQAVGLFGGLALFLYGLERMAGALRIVGGSRMRRILAALSSNRVVGMLSGALVTAIVQSSSVTTVMLVGFVSASLMTLPQTIGVILGANVGTTMTAQIVAFDLTQHALALVAVGFAVLFAATRERVRQYGYVVMGLGLIFFGMHVMSDAMSPLRGYPPFIALMAAMDHPAAGIAVAAAFTGIVQSSSATMGVVIVLAMQGVISLEAGIALALGANVGTCVTAGLASIGRPSDAVRVAAAHIVFNLAGVVLILPFLPWFTELVRWLSPVAEASLTGSAALADVVPRQVANAHTLFNVAMALGFLPFTGALARLLQRLVPDRPESEASLVEARYLDALLLSTPPLALEAARRELHRVGDRVVSMLDDALATVLHGTREELEALRARDDEVDALYARIVAYLGEVSKQPLSESDTRSMLGLMGAANELESIGDLIETDIVTLGERRLERGLRVSEETEAVLTSVHREVVSALQAAVRSVDDSDRERARAVRKLKRDVHAAFERAEAHQARRLVVEAPARLSHYSLETDVLDRLRRAFYHARRLAKTVGA